MKLSQYDLLCISQLQARDIAGKEWKVQGQTLRFADFDPRYPGEPPWKSGGEGIACPLLDAQGRVVYYAKFFDQTRITEKRVRRAQWLAGQQASGWAPQFLAAPVTWVTGSPATRPKSIRFDFSCLLSVAAPGRPWQEIKADITSGAVQWTDDLRRRAVRDFIAGLAILERRNFIHGDLSHGNLVLDPAATSGSPVLCFIDFDAFVCPVADELASLSTAEGGTFGTPDYCPPSLVAGSASQDVRPFSDRFARDTLLVELLGFDSTCASDEAASKWDTHVRQKLLGRAPFASQLPHLLLDTLFQLPEHRRPHTCELAAAIGIPVGPPVKSRVWLADRHKAAAQQKTGVWGRTINQTVLTPTNALTRVQTAATRLLAFLCLVHWSGAVTLAATNFPVSMPSLAVRLTWVIGWFGIWAAGLVVIVRIVIGDMRQHVLQVGDFQLELPFWFRPQTPKCPQRVLMHLGMLLLGLAVTILLFV